MSRRFGRRGGNFENPKTSAAFRTAIELLENEDCLAAVSSTSKNAKVMLKDLKRLDRINEEVKVDKGNTYGSATPQIDGVSAAEMSFYKLWYDDINLDMGVGKTTAKSLGLSPQQRRVLALLHELSHATSKYLETKQDYLANRLWFDETIDEAELNERIYKACIPVVASAAAGGKAQ